MEPGVRTVPFAPVDGGTGAIVPFVRSAGFTGKARGVTGSFVAGTAGVITAFVSSGATAGATGVVSAFVMGMGTIALVVDGVSGLGTTTEG